MEAQLATGTAGSRPAAVAEPPGRLGAAASGRVRVSGLGTALPAHRVSATEIAAALPRVWPRLARRGGGLLAQMQDHERCFARSLDELGRALPLGEQTAAYLAAALELATTAARQALAAANVEPGAVGCLVVTSCTGFVLPGLDARLVPLLGLRDDLVRMPFAQLGCAGGAAGLARAAEWLRADPGSAALVVAVELPSVTFRAGDTSIDNLLSAMVFGDGAAAAVLEGTGSRRSPAAASTRPLPSIGRASSVLLPGTTDVLGYDLADDGYRVVLARSLPGLLEASLPGIVERFLGRGAVQTLDVVAAHPGGPAILDAVQRGLRLRDAQLAASRATLRRSGNTSSAAVLFVLAELAASELPAGASGLLLAVGPGLAVEMLDLAWPG